MYNFLLAPLNLNKTSQQNQAMHMIKKEQIDLRDQSVQKQKEFIHQLFELAV